MNNVMFWCSMIMGLSVVRFLSLFLSFSVFLYLRVSVFMSLRVSPRAHRKRLGLLLTLLLRFALSTF